MSRETAPRYRVHDCCFYCVFAVPITPRGMDCCVKHSIYFEEGESRARVCDDFQHWKKPCLVGVPDVFTQEIKTQNIEVPKGED